MNKPEEDSRLTATNDSKGSSSALKYETFVTPPIPIASKDRPANVDHTVFQAMAATLIYGKNDAVLVDTFMTVAQANSLADWVESKHRNLYITHGHGDHWFGAGTILERFPKAKLVATALHVPSIGLVVAGDAASNDVHLYLVESNAQQRQEWIAALDKIDALHPRAVIASHKRPENDDNPKIIEETRQYIRDFDRLTKSTKNAQELYDQMLALYPDRINPGWALWGSAHAQKQ